MNRKQERTEQRERWSGKEMLGCSGKITLILTLRYVLGHCFVVSPKYQPSGRGNQIVSQNCLKLSGIVHAVYVFNQCPWTSGIKRDHNITEPPPYFTYEMPLLVCISVSTPNMQMLYLTKAFNSGLTSPEHCFPVLYHSYL